MDEQVLRDLISGATEKGKELRSKEALFLKASGINEQIEQSRSKLVEKQNDLKSIKEELAALVIQKNESMSKTTTAMIEKMNKVLPEGEAVFHIEGKKVFFGLQINGHFTHFGGLSGGEEAMFKSALAYALGAGFLIQESAEIDNKKLAGSLESLAAIEEQIIVNTCHMPPGSFPDVWSMKILT